MDNDRIDRRVRRTKAQLVTALTNLLAEKELKDISVSELTRLADVNRGTFYLHYRDTYDLFAQLEGELLDSFLSIIDRYRGQSPIFWRNVMHELFSYVQVNGPAFRAVLGVKESAFLDRLIEQVKPASMSEWQNLFGGGGSIVDYEYFYAFITSGCVALVGSWFRGGCRETAQQMATLAERLMSACTNELAASQRRGG